MLSEMAIGYCSNRDRRGDLILPRNTDTVFRGIGADFSCLFAEMGVLSSIVFQR
jgi:hypothetical protein